jgi:hypothetical protein
MTPPKSGAIPCDLKANQPGKLDTNTTPLIHLSQFKSPSQSPDFLYLYFHNTPESTQLSKLEQNQEISSEAHQHFPPQRTTIRPELSTKTKAEDNGSLIQRLPEQSQDLRLQELQSTFGQP